MTDGMSTEQIERVFGALSRIEQKIDSHVDTVDAHMKHDQDVQKLLFDRVEAMQLTQARQKGFITAIVSVGSVLGAGIGYAVEVLLGRH
jgi:hypothetical protein